MVFYIALVLSFLLATSAEDPTLDDGVVVLTDANFKKWIPKQPLALIEFYAPWCGHCKRLAPEYVKAAAELTTANPPVPLAKIDCTAQKKTCEKYGVTGYPTLKVFRNGAATDYKGPRVATGIVKHMMSLVGPSSIEVTTMEEAEKYVPDARGKGVTKVIVMGFFKAKDSDYDRFLEAAEELRGKFTFVHTHAEEVLRSYGYRHTFVVFRPFDSPNAVPWEATRAISKSAMKSFVSLHGLPLAGEMTEDNQELYRYRDLTEVVMFTNVDFKNNEKRMNYLLNRLRKIATKFSNFSVALADKQKFRHIYDRFSFTDVELQSDLAIGVYLTSRDIRWKFDGKKFGVAELEAFITRLNDGKVPAFIKSESAPANNPKAGEGKVVTVTANTFREIVMDESKDVLIELYAPWCGHCKKLTPIYEALAKEYEGVADVVIAKMDATANDTPPGYTASGFPTIYWAPKNGKVSPVKFQGDRTVEAFKKFIKEKQQGK
eukprot:PhF_6_TR27028/c0_g1_i1/m.39476/K08056/PDIA3, GRP58; protein disulfide isomerase family A, member 3